MFQTSVRFNEQSTNIDSDEVSYEQAEAQLRAALTEGDSVLRLLPNEVSAMVGFVNYQFTGTPQELAQLRAIVEESTRHLGDDRRWHNHIYVPRGN